MNKTVHLTFFVVLINVEKRQQLVEHGISRGSRKSQKLSLKVEKKLPVGFKWPCA